MNGGQGLVIDDRDGGLSRAAKGGIDRIGEADGEGFAAFVDQVVGDVDGEELFGLARGEGEAAAGGGVVCTGEGGASGGEIINRDRETSRSVKGGGDDCRAG